MVRTEPTYNLPLVNMSTHLKDVRLDTGDARGEVDDSEAEGATESSRLGAAAETVSQVPSNICRHRSGVRVRHS